MIDDITCVIVYFDEGLIQHSLKASQHKKNEYENKILDNNKTVSVLVI